MKRVSQLTALALLMGLAAAATSAADAMPTLTLSTLQQHNGVAIDTRLSAFYNGWPQGANGPQGHEPQALNLAAGWLGAMTDEQLGAGLSCTICRPQRRLRCTATPTTTRKSRRALRPQVSLISARLAMP